MTDDGAPGACQAYGVEITVESDRPQTRAEREEELRLASIVSEGLAVIERYFKQPNGALTHRDLTKAVTSVHESFGALRMLDAKVSPAWMFDVVSAAISQLDQRIKGGAQREALHQVWRELIKQVQVNLRSNRR
jgi:hypothetical protein